MVEQSGVRPDTAPAALGNLLDIVERISRMASIAAIPVVLAIGGWIIQRQLQNQSISRDYVQLALNILQNPDQSKVAPELREWAVDLLNDNSSTKLNARAVASLKSGTVTLPSFSFVPSRALTSDLKTELESSLTSFQSYMQRLGFPAGTRPVSVKITPGSDDQGMVAAWDAETGLIIVAEAFAHDKVTLLRQLAHGLLSPKRDGSREYFAIESGLATYLASVF